MSTNLSQQDKEFFYKQGYVVLKNAVPEKYISTALRAINKQLGAGITPEQVAVAEKSTWCPTLCATPYISNLFNASKTLPFVQALLGQNVPQVMAGQIALRFPGTLCIDKQGSVPAPWWNKAWHVDGFPSEHNGISKVIDYSCDKYLGHDKKFYSTCWYCIERCECRILW